jgi:hypothetical protein
MPIPVSAMTDDGTDDDAFVQMGIQLWPKQVRELDRLAREAGISRAAMIRIRLDVGLGFRDMNGRLIEPTPPAPVEAVS